MASKPKDNKIYSAEEAQALMLRERIRCQQILEAPEAKGRESLAHALAFTAGLPTIQALELLSAAPRQDQYGATLLAESLGVATAASNDDPLQALAGNPTAKRAKREAEIVANLKGLFGQGAQ